MQTQTPPARATPSPTIVVPGANGTQQTIEIPTTRVEVRELIGRREQLSDQLSNVSERRQELASEILGTNDEIVRSGLQQRVQLLDKRILQLETDLATTGQQLAAAPLSLTSGISSSTDGPFVGNDNYDEGMATGAASVFALAVVFFFVARRKWRRAARRGQQQPQLTAEAGQRLERLEQGMEAIAIEIERISEGQRFVTKLLSESPPAIGAARPAQAPAVVGQAQDQ